MLEQQLASFAQMMHCPPVAQYPGKTERQASTNPVNTIPLQVSEQDILKAVQSFPSDSAGGPDGIRPQHVLEWVRNQAPGHTFLPALTSFINLLL